VRGDRPRVGVSRDFLGADGQNLWGDIGLDRLTQSGVDWKYLADDVDVLRPTDLAGLDALIFARPAVDAESLPADGSGPRLLARFGVGYDAVDLDPCTRAGVIVTITPDGARRAVATAALTMLLAALHHLPMKDRIVRSGDWSPRTAWMGRGLTGSTIGLLGMGNTGSDLVGLLAPFGCQVLACDPFADAARSVELGVELVGRDELAARSDSVIVMAALTEQTHHLVDEAFLSAMRPGSVMVNIARGPIVDEAALVAALRRGTPAVAALDVFEVEPLPANSPLLELDNVVLAPHCLAWTDEMSRGNGGSAVQAVLDMLAGKQPRFVVNRDALQHPALVHLAPPS
jgi:phosphoglycerate dehydrogenase-like enzyme